MRHASTWIRSIQMHLIDLKWIRKCIKVIFSYSFENFNVIQLFIYNFQLFIYIFSCLFTYFSYLFTYFSYLFTYFSCLFTFSAIYLHFQLFIYMFSAVYLRHFFTLFYFFFLFTMSSHFEKCNFNLQKSLKSVDLYFTRLLISHLGGSVEGLTDLYCLLNLIWVPRATWCTCPTPRPRPTSTIKDIFVWPLSNCAT